MANDDYAFISKMRKNVLILCSAISSLIFFNLRCWEFGLNFKNNSLQHKLVTHSLKYTRWYLHLAFLQIGGKKGVYEDIKHRLQDGQLKLWLLFPSLKSHIIFFPIKANEALPFKYHCRSWIKVISVLLKCWCEVAELSIKLAAHSLMEQRQPWTVRNKKMMKIPG